MTAEQLQALAAESGGPQALVHTPIERWRRVEPPPERVRRDRRPALLWPGCCLEPVEPELAEPFVEIKPIEMKRVTFKKGQAFFADVHYGLCDRCGVLYWSEIP